MSNSLKLTLKQFLDLGIICSHKKKKRRNTTVQKQMETPIMSYLPARSQSFSQQPTQFSNPLVLNPYSQAVRLREEQERLRIEQLEQRMRQENLQSNIMSEFKNVYNTRRINDINQDYDQPDKGFAYDDNAGAFGRSADDSQFKPQAGGFALEEEEVGFGIGPEQLSVEEEEGGYDTAQEIQPPQELPRNKPRASRKDIGYYKGLYGDLAGVNAETSLFKATKVSEIKPAIIKLLLAEYRSVGGTNRDVLRSKNIETIRDEITLLRSILKSP